MTGWTPGFRQIFPSGLEPAELFQPHEDRVQSTGGDSGKLIEGVTVVPVGRLNEQRLKHKKGLAGFAQASGHALNLPI